MGKQEHISQKMKDLADFGADNVVRLRLSQGDEFRPTNWLDNLNVGDSFISQTKKGFSVWLDEYTIMGKQEDMTLLRDNRIIDGHNANTWQWTDNEAFCNENDLRKILNE